MLIYIVEDDDNIREMESYALTNSGFETQSFSNGADFFAACDKTSPSLAILDIMLPGDDGITILKHLRESIKLQNTPVMMVTAKTTEMDKVRGLDCGADDYLSKPFGILELVSRVKALLRRVPTVQIEEPNVLSCGEIKMDDARHSVKVGDKSCDLTFKEYELLKLLLINCGIVLSRETIMDRVWGFDFAGESRTVDVHIKTLRQKLGKSGEKVKTVRNVGYKLEE